MNTVAATQIDTTRIWDWLTAVPDPEIPVISIVDLGIVRDLRWNAQAQTCHVTVTPTYSGCPATEVINRDIRSALQAQGIERVEIEIRLSPAWTTDWLAPAAREKLRAYGIAPPVGRSTDGRTEHVVDLRQLRRAPPAPDVVCPHCGSPHTEITSVFGSTPCKSLYRCRDCREPFDYFKCH
ncbi:1,2-phenylacetyl-CoA epoxidase subunit PaaD [Solimonas marina]|uniref:Phenylacetate-CoA oxygenase subunit PaaJ n=1 Tax=Solimonas marina TaxID=2714601 RepID=A0A970B9M5_9GAMM|nr:phenylacetate-CoA oxygenase subunit PaaJ [Solimonas marina]